MCLEQRHKSWNALVDMPGLESLLPTDNQPFAKCTMALAVDTVCHPFLLVFLLTTY
jgi:hypothetical protein